MGLTDKQAAELQAALTPIVVNTKQSGDVVTEDATIGNEERLRGIPAVGRVGGTMKGCRPGDPVSGLDEAGTVILKGLLQRSRRKDYL